MTKNGSLSTYAILEKNLKCEEKHSVIDQIKARVLLVIETFHLMKFVHVMVR